MQIKLLDFRMQNCHVESAGCSEPSLYVRLVHTYALECDATTKTGSNWTDQDWWLMVCVGQISGRLSQQLS